MSEVRGTIHTSLVTPKFMTSKPALTSFLYMTQCMKGWGFLLTTGTLDRCFKTASTSASRS